MRSWVKPLSWAHTQTHTVLQHDSRVALFIPWWASGCFHLVMMSCLKSFDSSRQVWPYENEKLNAVFARISAGEAPLWLMRKKIKIWWSPPLPRWKLCGEKRRSDSGGGEWKLLKNSPYHASAFWFIDTGVDRNHAACAEFDVFFVMCSSNVFIPYGNVRFLLIDGRSVSLCLCTRHWKDM